MFFVPSFAFVGLYGLSIGFSCGSYHCVVDTR